MFVLPYFGMFYLFCSFHIFRMLFACLIALCIYNSTFQSVHIDASLLLFKVLYKPQRVVWTISVSPEN